MLFKVHVFAACLDFADLQSVRQLDEEDRTLILAAHLHDIRSKW